MNYRFSGLEMSPMCIMQDHDLFLLSASRLLINMKIALKPLENCDGHLDNQNTHKLIFKENNQLNYT